MPEVELEAVPKSLCGGRYLVIGGVAVYKFAAGKWTLAACCKDIDDAGEASDALGIREPLFTGVHDRDEAFAYT